jgi:hypothetical protein
VTSVAEDIAGFIHDQAKAGAAPRDIQARVMELWGVDVSALLERYGKDKEADDE